MKVYNNQSDKSLHSDLVLTLEDLRKDRAFDAKKYIDNKAKLLNKYMEDCGLKSCLVAVSGGIDSAVTLGLVYVASKLDGSPIKKVVAVMLPVFSKDGATNQNDALARGKEVALKFGITPTVVDLTDCHALLKKTVDGAMNFIGAPWASGQLVAYARTPALYYITSLLTEQGISGILCGTTNRDEGAYLGYVGKASDGMVDVQMISDLHKSEVYKVAKILGVPSGSINAVPTGDMYDGRTDEEVFGASYDFVELYLLLLSIKDKVKKSEIMSNWSTEAKGQFDLLKDRVEHLHNYNKHKYVSKSPSVHLDIYESNVPGGWTNINPLKDWCDNNLWK